MILGVHLALETLTAAAQRKTGRSFTLQTARVDRRTPLLI